jgi:phosphatidate cytidylyltransferase
MMMFILVSWLWRGRGEEDFGDIGVTVFAFCYVGGLGTFLVSIEALEWSGLAPDDGVRALVWVLLSAKSADIFAYFTGKAIGKHKLAAHISPGKTIEGAIGGLAGSIAVGCALKPFMGAAGESLSWVWVVVFAAACSIACQLGDLIESRLKRRAGVKDSGELVPEFGGFLDIVDGLIFAAPVGYAILRIVGGGHH